MTTQLKNPEIDWEKCSKQLYEQIRYKVYQMKLPRWEGEEDDIAWDVVQESMRKFLEYLQRVEEGARKPVEKLEGMLYIIALNSLKDRRRREVRLCPETEYMPAGSGESISHLSEVATENVYQEDLFHFVAQKIAHFPTKQRGALLVDLASMMAFEDKPTSLQAAFRDEGIRLEEYRFRQPGNEKERSRHAALLYQANQRLRELHKDIQKYLKDEDLQKCLV